jgi:subtilisin family serine protease
MPTEYKHIEIPRTARLAAEPRQPRGGAEPFSRSRKHRRKLGERFHDINETLAKRRGSFPDPNAYFVIYSYGYLNHDALAKEGIEVLATKDRRVRKIPYRPTRVLGDPASFKETAVAAQRKQDHSTDFITAWARPIDNDIQYVENRLLKPNRPNAAFEHVVNFASVWDEPRASTLVANTNAPSAAYRIDLMPGLDEATYKKIIEAIKADLGPSSVKILRREPHDVVLDLFASKSQLDALLAKVPSILYATVRPEYTWGRPAEAEAADELPVAPTQLPPPTGTVGVIDSGASTLNPWLRPFVRPGRDFVNGQPASPTDTNGHGTKVSGHAAMYDVLTSGVVPAGTNAVVPAQIDQGGKPWADIETQTPTILAWLQQQRVGVANLSINSTTPTYGAFRSAWTESVDNFLAANDFVLVASAGNIPPDTLQILEDEGVSYPAYYAQPYVDDLRICSPGDASNTLTVGSVSLIEGPADPHLIARHTWPSPHTRHSPSFCRPYGKPDLSEEGGNFRKRPNRPIELAADHCPLLLTANPRIGVPPTHPDHAKRDAGTSFSAPLVSWLAAQLRARNPDWTANLVRAVILQSTRANSAGFALDPAALAGLGTPDLTTALSSRPNSVTYTWHGSMPLGGAEAIKFWMPTAFAEAAGTKTARATLVLNPQVDRFRNRYAATTILPSLVLPGTAKAAPARQWFWSSTGYHAVRQAEWAFQSTSSKAMQQSDREWMVKLECKADRGNRRMKGPNAPTSQAYALVITLEVEDDAVDLPAAIIRDWVRLRETVREPIRIK